MYEENSLSSALGVIIHLGRAGANGLRAIVVILEKQYFDDVGVPE